MEAKAEPQKAMEGHAKAKQPNAIELEEAVESKAEPSEGKKTKTAHVENADVQKLRCHASRIE